MPNLYSSTLYRSATFNGHMPDPFSEWDTKNIDERSRYNRTSRPTNLHAPTIKALIDYCGLLKNARPKLGIGSSSQLNSLVLEKFWVNTPDNKEYADLFIWNPTTGVTFGAVYDCADGTADTYDIGETGRFGSSVFLLLIHHSIDNDTEFKETFQAFNYQYERDFPDSDTALAHAAILSDNLYRRMLAGQIHIDIPNDGLIPHTTPEEWKIRKKYYGEFSIFQQSTAERRSMPTPKFSEFVNAYEPTKRKLTRKEKALIPSDMEEYYVVPYEAVEICRHIKETTGSKNPVRNILLRGPSGTGKTDLARACAAALRRPYLFYTCHTHTESIDLLGSIIPRINDTGTSPADAELERRLALPTDKDIEADPTICYELMGGGLRDDITAAECMDYKRQKLQAAKAQNTTDFEFVYTPLVRALKYGYTVEIQEPTVIAQEGVLVGLNGLLDQCGKIELPTGEIITRHPDTVVILTTNTDYAGCRPLNQSVISRMDLICDLHAPDLAQQVERVKLQTGFENDTLLMQMAETVQNIAEHCQNYDTTDGVTGMRELQQWVTSYQILNDIFESARLTILPSATADLKTQEELEDTFLTPTFAGGRAA
uniref:ATPase dynein-related AAA domain-containing protein n=1 Tax=uncultured Bacillota bacterium TaxID=344338 RepID=A0A650ENN3_9FIRM|nr:hypothetical protein Firmicute1046_0070 [uncultured Firmicutes bacterium]